MNRINITVRSIVTCIKELLRNTIKSYKTLRNELECLVYRKKEKGRNKCLKVVEPLPYRNGGRFVLSSL